VAFHKGRTPNRRQCALLCEICTTPDLKLTIEEIVSSGDKSWARITARGTHQAPFMGRPPTGKSFTITVIDICRFEAGQIVEHWGVADRLGLMGQLGLLPPPPQKPA